jgi:hypothetical protein
MSGTTQMAEIKTVVLTAEALPTTGESAKRG